MDSATGVEVGESQGKEIGRDDVAVKIARAIVGKARLIAAHRGTSVADLLSEMLHAPVDKAYAQMLRELEKGAKP